VLVLRCWFCGDRFSGEFRRLSRRGLRETCKGRGKYKQGLRTLCGCHEVLSPQVDAHFRIKRFFLLLLGSHGGLDTRCCASVCKISDNVNKILFFVDKQKTDGIFSRVGRDVEHVSIDRPVWGQIGNSARKASIFPPVSRELVVRRQSRFAFTDGRRWSATQGQRVVLAVAAPGTVMLTQFSMPPDALVQSSMLREPSRTLRASVKKDDVGFPWLADRAWRRDRARDSHRLPIVVSGGCPHLLG
jgi:hypothetical protein